MATITFFLKAPRTTAGNLKKQPELIYLFYTINRDARVKISTGLKVRPTDWDFKKQRPKPQTTVYGEIKPKLDKLEGIIRAEAAEMENKGATFAQLKERLKEVTNANRTGIKIASKDRLTLLDVYHKYIESKEKYLKPLTVKKYKTLLFALEKYEAAKGKRLYFDDITLQWYDDFKNFLLTDRKNKYTDTPGIFNETLAKYISNFKNFMKWSRERRYHNNDVYTLSTFSAKREPRNEIVTLTQDELRKLHTVDLQGNQRLERVRDLGIFLCHTLQRWGDVHTQQAKDIDRESRTWIFNAHKTNKKTIVRFIGYFEPAWGILEKYDFQLPRMTDQEFNRIFKRVGELAGITEPVEIKRKQAGRDVVIKKPKFEFMSSHMGRRTGTSLLVNNGFPLTLLMKITGHTDVKTLMKYVRDDDELLVKALHEVQVPILPQMKIAK